MTLADGIEAVIFDMDDTLYPERDFVRSGYGAVAEELRSRLGTMERYEDWLWERFLAGRADGAFDALDGHFHLGLSVEDIRHLVEVYRFHTPAITPHADMVRLLADLQGRAKLGMVTDGPVRMQQQKFDALGLADYFAPPAVVLTGALGPAAGKPSPAGFEAVARALATPHEACVYLADNAAKDFLAPNRLGWASIRLRRAGQVHAHKSAPPGGTPQHDVDSVAAVRAILGLG